MAFIDGPELILFVVALGGAAIGFSGIIFNILGLIEAARLGPAARNRLILHAIGIPIYPLGWVLGLVWWFKWRKVGVA